MNDNKYLTEILALAALKDGRIFTQFANAFGVDRLNALRGELDDTDNPDYDKPYTQAELDSLVNQPYWTSETAEFLAGLSQETRRHLAGTDFGRQFASLYPPQWLENPNRYDVEEDTPASLEIDTDGRVLVRVYFGEHGGEMVLNWDEFLVLEV